jgi:hypothetical protein
LTGTRRCTCGGLPSTRFLNGRIFLPAKGDPSG